MAVVRWTATGKHQYGPLQLFNGSSGESDVLLVNGHVDSFGLYVRFDALVTGGSVNIVTADDPDAPGSWAVLATIPASGGDTYLVEHDGWVGSVKAVVTDAIVGGVAKVIAGGLP